MKVTIMQPAYLPWLGFFDRVDASDLFIILDNVLLDTSSKTRFTNRNKIRTKEGSMWLTLPMKTKGLHGKVLINEIDLVQDKWKKKHWKSIQNNYQKAPFFPKYKDEVQSFFEKDWVLMQDLLDRLTVFFFKVLNIQTKMIKASDLNVLGTKDELIINLCKEVKATCYYSGIFGKDYLSKNGFHENKIELFFHEYQHPTYSQTHKGFEPYMSILDLLFNHGEASLAIIRQGRNFTQ